MQLSFVTLQNIYIVKYIITKETILQSEFEG